MAPTEILASQHYETLSPIFAGMPEDVTEENMQARIRGSLLMAISNKTGAILLNTSNKSEAAVGYGTLYGDSCGALSVIGDIYKTEVYELAEYINRERFGNYQCTFDIYPGKTYTLKQIGITHKANSKTIL